MAEDYTIGFPGGQGSDIGRNYRCAVIWGWWRIERGSRNAEKRSRTPTCHAVSTRRRNAQHPTTKFQARKSRTLLRLNLPPSLRRSSWALGVGCWLLGVRFVLISWLRTKNTPFLLGSIFSSMLPTNTKNRTGITFAGVNKKSYARFSPLLLLQFSTVMANREDPRDLASRVKGRPSRPCAAGDVCYSTTR